MNENLVLFGIIFLIFIVIFAGCTNNISNEKNTSNTLSIEYFNAEPEWVFKGNTTMLSWLVIGASNVTIDNEIGDVSLIGNKAIFPEETTTYTLTASDGVKTITETTKIYVVIEKNESNDSNLSEEEIQELNQRFESLLSSVTDKEGYHCKLSMGITSFKLGEPINQVRINCSYGIPFDLGRTICQLDGYYQKGNPNTFSGRKGCATNWFGSIGNLDVWTSKPSGKYYYYLGIYDCTDIENDLQSSCNESNKKDILLNVTPLIYDRIEITVSNELVDCMNSSHSSLCWKSLAKVTGNCSYCENLESGSFKNSCYREC